MKIGLRQFENDDVEWFREADAGNAYSRYGLAKELCLRVGWRGSGGKLSVTQAYLALPKLACELSVSLPEVCGSRLDALAIMNTRSKQEEWDKGSSVLRWWARSQYRRSSCQLPFQITIYDPSELSNY